MIDNEVLRQPKVSAEEKGLYPYPNGWFVVAFSHLLKPNEIKSIVFMGQDLVLYRTDSDKACVSDAFCPHMGAHFGHGGKILGEEILCPYHGFRFDCSGTCTATGYNTKAPPKARLHQWPVNEKNGIISVYHDKKGELPKWELPTMDRTGWTELLTTEYEINSHPQETTENIVDVGHFAWIHGYSDVTEESTTAVNGPIISVHYAFSRNGAELGRKDNIRVYIRANAYGLGYSFVDTVIPSLGLKTKNFVFPTPTSNGKIILRLGLAVTELESSAKLHPLAFFIPKKWMAKIVLKAAFKGYCKDVRDDFKIWNNKKYIMKPPLAKGDGPIALYRKWARQFYD